MKEFSGENLRKAIEFRQVTQKSLAESIETSSSNITKWIAGTHFPEQKNLQDLSWALDFPVSWFLSEFESDEPKVKFYRSLKNTVKKQKKRMDVILEMLERVFSLYSEYLDFPEVNLPCVFESNPNLISDREILESAIEARKWFGFGMGPAGNIVDALESRGVIVGRCSVGGLKIDGVSQWRNFRPYILLASDKANPIRNRFDVAHELGHLILHRGIVEYNEENEKLIEQQANLFASEFLFPTEIFAMSLARYDMNGFLKNKQKWLLSIKSQIFKAKYNDLISKEYSDRLYRHYSARGWSRCEPLDDVIPFEVPVMLRDATNYLLENDLLSSQEIIDQTGLWEDLFKELLGDGVVAFQSSNVSRFSSKKQKSDLFG